MSVDAQIWCVLPHPEPIEVRGRDWTILGAPSVSVEAEDVPDAVAPLLPGVAHLVELHLAPVGATGAGARALSQQAKAIAAACRGVVFDPASGEAIAPRGQRRYVPVAERGTYVDLLVLSWWMDHDALTTRDGIARLFDVIERVLPEAMPQRYGSFEPMQHRLDEGGRPALEAFLMRETDSPVTRCAPPVRWLHVNRRPRDQAFAMHRRYRACRVELGVDASVLSQPGWQLALARAFRSLSEALEPFYGEVRTRRGYERKGGKLLVRMREPMTEPHPVRGWWWTGVPPLGHALVVGPPYRALWPELDAIATREGDLAFVIADDWRDARPVAEVPARLAMPPPTPHRSFAAAELATRVTSAASAEQRTAEVFPFRP